MSKYMGLRLIRRGLDAATMFAAVFLIAVFALTASMLQPEEAAYYQPGLVSEYGLGTVMLLLFMMGAGLMGVLFLISRYPKIYRYPVEITQNNVEIQFLLAKITFSLLQLICAAYFCALMIGVFQATIPLGSYAFYTLTGAALGAAGIFFVSYILIAKLNK